jgi:hypothetical protein
VVETRIRLPKQVVSILTPIIISWTAGAGITYFLLQLKGGEDILTGGLSALLIFAIVGIARLKD